MGNYFDGRYILHGFVYSTKTGEGANKIPYDCEQQTPDKNILKTLFLGERPSLLPICTRALFLEPLLHYSCA